MMLPRPGRACARFVAFFLPLLALCFSLRPAPAAQAPPRAVWVEGESFAALNVSGKPVTIAGWGHPEFLSGEKWLQINIDADQVDKTLPPDGVVIRYGVTLPAAATWAVWNRVGYEFVRSPFQWRVDGGAWQTVRPDQLTTDLMELANWTEVAWLKMGDVSLPAGAHTLEIRLTKTLDSKGKTDRILYASDALCFAPGDTFTPDGRNRPGETETAKTPLAAFAVTPAAADSRATLPLAGVWEIARDDEALPGPNVAQALALPAAPDRLRWKTIPVPGDKNTLRPDLLMAHRVWYRTHVRVPDSMTGRAWSLAFGENNLNTTVYVNGVLCGFEKNPYVHFAVDLTPGIKPGADNEIWVGIRDAWYGYSASPTDPMKLRRMFNMPLEFTHHGFQDFAYPVWGAMQSGILATPVLTAAPGGTYARDVFVRPSVSRKRLDADVTLRNALMATGQATITTEVIDDKTGAVAHRFAPFSITLGGVEQEVMVGGAWPDAKLWWPDPNPQLYRLRVTLRRGDYLLDTSETTFGFREWGVAGTDFTLNGQPWRVWADLTGGDTPEAYVRNYRLTNQRIMRLMGPTQNGGPTWKGMDFDHTLDFFDRNGILVRRCGPLDGEAIGYNAIENDPALRDKYQSPIKMDLMENWRDQMVAQVKGERNHPSVMLWSLENEWLYINCINLYADKMDLFEREVAKCSEAVRAADPTRLTMTDGGGANRDQSMPVHGNHYVQAEFDRYPALAYERNPQGGGRGRWTWDEKRPRFIGEDYFASGINNAEYAEIGGEEAFAGKIDAHPAMGVMYRILTEGYRWAGQSAWQFWLDRVAPDQYVSQSPVAVFCRQWDWSFAPGQTVKRTLGLFNDTHNPAPLTLTRTLTVKGRTVQTITSRHNVAPGQSEKFDVTLPLPPAQTARTEGAWTLAVTQNGQEVYRRAYPLALIRPTSPAPTATLAKAGRVAPLLVYDPHGETLAFFKARRLPVVALASLEGLASAPALARVLVVGRDALTPTEAGASRLAAWAGAGRSVVVLEQAHPLHGPGLPTAAIETDGESTGRAAFIENHSHPVFRNVEDSDLFTWGAGETVYRAAYHKPTRGAVSLVQCHTRLGDTALAEVPAGSGVLMVSQLLIGEKLATCAPAQQLLLNLVEYARTYHPQSRPVSLVASAGASRLPDVLASVGIAHKAVSDPLAALDSAGGIAVVDATPANLERLASNTARIERFAQSGGWLVFNNLTPDGLASYNKIVGWQHLIRPFRRERVTFPRHKNPLTAGLSASDIALTSGVRINGYNGDEYSADDVFSYVVDYDDVAPFMKVPDGSYWGLQNATDDHNPLNVCNGYTSQDDWRLAFMMWAGQGGKPEFPFRFDSPQTIRRIEWAGNTTYLPTTQITLTFDGKNPVALDTQPTGEAQMFTLPPGRIGRDILLRITKTQDLGKPPIAGIDNVRLFAARPDAFYSRVQPLLNIGAMMTYPRGRGGIILCNVRFQETESVPANAAKKRNILATLLHNLHAPSAGDATVIPGMANLTYTPISLAGKANQFRGETGWFGDKRYTFAALPTGRQTMGGVAWDIYDFATSPVPTTVMLGGGGVPGSLPDAVRDIPVGRKADALLFLHTARIDRPRDPNEVRENKHIEFARYIVTYDDGQKVSIPIYLDETTGDYHPALPLAPPSGAAVAWSRPYDNERVAVAYSYQWNNPRPQVAIRSLDLEYGDGRGRAVPVLLAVTAVSAK